MNAADLLAARLAELGVRRVYGEGLTGATLPGLDPVEVADPDLAVLLADADGRIGEVDGRGRLGAALLAGPILHLSSEPGGTAPLQTVGSAEEMLDALVDPPGLVVPGASALHLDLDLSAPVPDGLAASVQPDRRPVMTLDRSMAALRMVVVVGPGVVRAGALDGLRSLSRAAGAGVLNTWGAKGVERWDSPWHFGTAGLQARDLELAGLGGPGIPADCDVVIASGIDTAELPGGHLPHAVVQEVAPAQLGALCQHWPGRAGPPAARPALYDAIAAVVGPLYESDSVPLTPARAALHLSGALPGRGMAVADAGIAGLWIARAFPTSIPNSVCVPATVAPGFAVAAAMACALEGRAVLAVTDAEGVEAPETEALMELAGGLGLAVGLQVWDDGGGPGWAAASGHVELLEAHLAGGGCRVDHVPVDFGCTAALEAAAGPVTAWA
jgi:hypothetical protein